MKLQLALDRLSKEECFKILENTAASIDWIEVGTGVIKEYGMSIIKEIKERYPDKTIVADMKTCDAGTHEAEQAFNAGADITTVMAFSHDGTVVDMLDVASKHQKRVMVDLLGITDAKRVKQLNRLGADLLSLHIGKDMQQEGETATSTLFDLLAEVKGVEVAVAGGINEESLSNFLTYKPDVLIIGSAITKAEEAAEVAKRLKGMISL